MISWSAVAVALLGASTGYYFLSHPQPLQIHVGASAKQGLRQYMEDEVLLTDDTEKDLTPGSRLDTTTCHSVLMGVFDGHGGARASRVAREQLPSHISLVDNRPVSPKELVAAFDLTEQDYLKATADHPVATEGSTAVLAVLQDCYSSVTVANTGDSRCVVCKDGKVALASEDHKPDGKEERSRIEALGGSVKHWGVPRVFKGNHGLALSRALGDTHYGELVPNTPDVQRLDLDPMGDYDFILGSDGLWDVISSEEACQAAHAMQKKGVSAQDTAETLVEGAIRKGSTDNVSAVVMNMRR